MYKPIDFYCHNCDRSFEDLVENRDPIPCPTCLLLSQPIITVSARKHLISFRGSQGGISFDQALETTLNLHGSDGTED